MVPAPVTDRDKAALRMTGCCRVPGAPPEGAPRFQLVQQYGAELQHTRAVPQRCALLPTGCAPQSPIEQALQHPLEPAGTPLHPRENAQFFRKRRVSADCNQRGILGGYGPQPGSLWGQAAHWPPNMPGNTGSIRPCCDTRLPSADELRFPFLVFSSKEFS